MTTQELIELSLLDAYGLLDETERAAFDAAFVASPPAVQAQVRREQTRLAKMDSLLPEAAPPAGLRAAVIEAVRRAMAEVGITERATAHGAGRVPPMLPNRRVSPLWRAAALGLSTAVVVLGVTVAYVQASFDELTRQIHTDTLLAQMQVKFGSPIVRDMLFDGDTSRVVFTAADAEFKGEASLFINPEWDKARLFCNALPASGGRAYKLAILDENDRVVEVLSTFESQGGLEHKQITLDPRSTARLAIVTSAEGSGELSIVSRAEMSKRSL